MVRVRTAQTADSRALDEMYFAAISNEYDAIVQVRDALQCTRADRVEAVHDLTREDIIDHSMDDGVIRLDHIAP